MRLYLFITGFVQGVNFRYYTLQEARRLGLTGWVRNKNDGLEIIAEGSKRALKKLLAWCRRGPAGAVVSEIKEKWEEGRGKFKGFEIKI